METFIGRYKPFFRWAYVPSYILRPQNIFPILKNSTREYEYKLLPRFMCLLFNMNIIDEPEYDH
jgi:hypothetical protein